MLIVLPDFCVSSLLRDGVSSPWAHPIPHSTCSPPTLVPGWGAAEPPTLGGHASGLDWEGQGRSREGCREAQGKEATSRLRGAQEQLGSWLLVQGSCCVSGARDQLPVARDCGCSADQVD